MPTLSLCMIVRNEAELLPRCLESVKGVVDEIVVVDTGSTDDTKGVAEAHGAKVGHFEWCDDFAAARNASLELASSDWILVLDADEILLPGSTHALKAAMASSEGGFLLPLENWVGEGKEAERQTVQLLRLFRNLPSMRYRGRVHEQVTESMETLGLTIGFCSARIRHDGYLAQRIQERDKYERNLKLLRCMVAEQPEAPYSWYQLGKTLLAMKRWAEAREPLEEALRLLDGVSRPETYTFYPLAYAHLANCLEVMEDREAALEILVSGIARLPVSAELRYRQGIYLRELGREDEALEAFLQGFHSEDPLRSHVLVAWLAGAIADLYWKRGDRSHAIPFYRIGAEQSEPRAAEPYLKLANALLEVGNLSGAAEAYETVIGLDPHQFGAQLALGTVYFEQGNFFMALSAFSAADRLKPGLPDLAILMGECKRRVAS